MYGSCTVLKGAYLTIKNLFKRVLLFLKTLSYAHGMHTLLEILFFAGFCATFEFSPLLVQYFSSTVRTISCTVLLLCCTVLGCNMLLWYVIFCHLSYSLSFYFDIIMMIWWYDTVWPYTLNNGKGRTTAAAAAAVAAAAKRITNGREWTIE